MIKSFYDLYYKIIDPMSIKCTHVHCAPVSCHGTPGHVPGAPGIFFKISFLRKTTRISA